MKRATIKKISGVAGITSAFLAITVPLAGGMFYPGYSHVSQYISELGAVDAPYQNIVNWGGFLPIGISLALFLILVNRFITSSQKSKIGLILFFGLPLAYIISAAAPCDPGCPEIGSVRQAVHNIGGLLGYIGGGLGLILWGVSKRNFKTGSFLSGLSITLGIVVLSMFAIMISASPTEFKGLWQRIAETALFCWVSVISIYLLTRPASRIKEGE